MECKKTKFVNEAQAFAYVEKLQKTSERVYKPSRAYLCPICLTWHLTKTDDWESLRIKRLEGEILKKNEIITRLEARIVELKNQLKSE